MMDYVAFIWLEPLSEVIDDDPLTALFQETNSKTAPEFMGK